MLGSFHAATPVWNGCRVYAVTLLVLMFVGPVSLAERPAWTASRIRGTPTAPLPYRVERVFGDHQFDHPVEMSSAPGSGSMFLLEQRGNIYELRSEGETEPRLIAELRKQDTELQAAYGLAFHPDFVANRQIFVCYKRKGDEANGSIVSRFRLTKSSPMEIEPDSQEILYTWRSGGHNGGSVQFGPDGYLYVSAGDSAAPFPPDPRKAGQDLSTLLSKIVRIDVDQRSDKLPYKIPTDNPFVDMAGARPEIYAYGFRNPWRMAFDRETGDLWVGDVGWELWEMIHLVESGGNYGWSIVEGPNPVDPEGRQGPTPIQKPAASHSHAESRSITGGQVYYGERLPELKGAYVYGDHVTGRIWSLRKTKDGFESPKEIARSSLQIICFGLHNNGELYVVDYVGSVHRLVRSPQSSANEDFPRKLSDSGLFEAVPNHTLAEGVLSYSINAEPWMDGASAVRFIGIPDASKIGVYEKGGGHSIWAGKHRGSWKFPKDSVLGKTISLGDRRVETQLMHFDGQEWQPYTYLWNDEQADAVLADDLSQTITVDVGDGQKKWGISNRGDCMICHTNANDMLLGFKPNQLRRPVSDAEDQLAEFASMGLIEKDPPNKSVVVDPYDGSAELDIRARSYLHVNCSHCHRPEGGGTGAIDLLFERTAEQTKMFDQSPLQGTFGIDNAKIIAQGDPYRSVLLYRFCKLGPGHMPKLGGIDVDQVGAQLLHDWIASLDSDSDGDDFDALLGELRNSAESEESLVEWLSDVRHSLVAVHAMQANSIDSPLRKKILNASRELPPATKDLYEAFIPVAERTKRLGINIDEQLVLAEPGDSQRGRRLFLSERLSCRSCHAIEVGQESAGPNFLSLKPTQYEAKVLLQNILHPSKDIDEAYHTHTVQTDDGMLFTGVVKPDGDVIVLRDAQGKTHRIPESDIEFRRASDISLMPENLLAELTLDEARDLIAFVGSLKEPK